MFAGLVKASIALFFILLFIYMVHPLITFARWVLENPTGSFNVVLEETLSYGSDELVLIKATLTYSVPVTLRDFRVTVCNSTVEINELKPGNYTLTFMVNTSSCGYESIDLTIDFKIEGLYRVYMVVAGWLKLGG